MYTIPTSENLLRYWRTEAKLTKAAFAAKMGLPLRTYEDLEAGKTTIRPVHIAAAKWAFIEIASEYPYKLESVPCEVKKVVDQYVTRL